MKTTHRITIDLIRKDVSQVAYAMQNDANSRVIEITLLENGVAWTPPAETSFALSYAKPDGTKGFYGTLPDGSNAISSDGNIVSATLAPQVLTVAGVANAALVIRNPDGNRISSFPFEIHVIADPSAGATDSEDYFDPSFCGANFLPMPAVANVGQYLRVAEVDKDGNVLKVEAVDIKAETPVAYLYNGTELPPLPDYDKETYPYAFLYVHSGPEFYVLKCFTVEPAKGLSGSALVPQSGTGQYISCTLKDGEWGSFGEPANFTALMGSVFEGRIWTNFDLRTKGSDYVWLAASEPVPVYSGGDPGGSGGSGGGIPVVTFTTVAEVTNGNAMAVFSAEETAAFSEAASKSKIIAVTFSINEGGETGDGLMVFTGLFTHCDFSGMEAHMWGCHPYMAMLTNAEGTLMMQFRVTE